MVQSRSTLRTDQLAIASNGDVYVALGFTDASFDEWIEVYRSVNGGDTFSLFGTINRAGVSTERLWGLYIAEGTVDRIFVLYQDSVGTFGSFAMKVAYEDLGASTATWTTSSIFDQAGVSFLNPDLDSDASSFSAYYLYAVSTGLDGNGDDVWFSRSTDYGATWSVPYRIASLTASGNLMYRFPKLRYGFGGVLHVGFTYSERLQDTFDDGVRYRRALNYGNAPSDWDVSLWALTPTNNGIDENLADCAASSAASTVMLLYGPGSSSSNSVAWYSDDAGAGWSTAKAASIPFTSGWSMLYRASTSEFIVSGSQYPGTTFVHVFCRSPLASPLAFSTPVQFAEDAFAFRNELALDPTRGDRVALTWVTGATAYFDAEWRGDPGYPNLEPGFPVALPAKPVTPPAVVSVDGDADMEVVYGDLNGDVWVRNHEGAVVAGWPRNVGSIPYQAPVAIGDLRGTGTKAIVVGNTTGQVYAFGPDGSPLDGWPVDLGTSASTYVSIGALGPPYPHWVVACSGTQLVTLNYRGQAGPAHSAFTGNLIGPAAIGDVDDDGVTEMVTVMGPAAVSGWNYVHVLSPEAYSVEAYRALPGYSLNGPATLADLNLNGDLEVVVPTEQGRVFAMHPDLSDLPGFPFDAGGGFPVTPVAMAQFLGTSEPELAFASLDYRLHVVFATGVEHSAYPRPTGSGWYLFGAPILNTVNASSSNPIIGSRDRQAWTYRNIGTSVPGWPKGLGAECELSPASGDIDNDGHDEIVFLTFTDLVVVDVGYPAQSLPGWSWPMYGYDPQRTGCLNCSEDLATAVGPTATVTRVSFAAPFPNPAQASVVFRYALPAAAAVDLQVFDVRGRQVRDVVREEQSAGEHLVGFDGRDNHGIALASGHYFAHLQVRGPGVSQTMTRRFSLLR